jgi:hypothetical protein
MTNTSRIADKLIAHSRGILSLAKTKPDADTVTIVLQPGSGVPHVMPIAAYEERFGAKEKAQ